MSNQIGKGIREYRKKLGLTQGELAEGICNRSYISQIEKGDVVPSPEILEELAKKLQTDLSTIFAPTVKPAFTKIEIENNFRHLVNSIDTQDWEIAHKWFNKLEGAEMSLEQTCMYLWSKAVLSENRNHFDIAESLFQESIKIARELDKYEWQVRILTSLGFHYCKAKNADKALPYLNEAMQLTNRYQINGLLHITLLHAAGYMHVSMGEIHSAIEHLKQAEQICKSLRAIYRMESIYLLLGVCQQILKQYEVAQRYYEKSLDILKISPSLALEANIYNNLAVIYTEQKHYQLAHEYITRAMSLHSPQDHAKQIESKIEHANILKGLQRYEEASQLCLEIFEHSINEHAYAEAKLVYASILCEMGKGSEALSHLEEALHYFNEYKSQRYLLKGLALLAKINLKFGKIDSFYYLYEQYIS
ncbi:MULTISPECIES: helix-turn-helix domain-containing protein [Brevibacillus]|uniref:Helix-turn-helix domain-containing protein n=1 Tax=Brevibacillus laterosporus TaxID=1465 RepID=A0AAP3DKN8_BRELA|nr:MULTISPECIES: helix-turn-helix transcriptional regulator [Brevibacillus]MBG9786874.1 DNA-binding protein [Brevibacillus laterosporus]MCG7317938.1 helix-turn-helix transcriptional regulator [Brevibacillus laterosporus]MCR8982227.1 helix-turn-helix transcriptional regulator [Brevibacillus laterosporus]MCZ0809382.1 helix-turn-helix transcriptional regulator [Brevibacillus laterosporus]MCZ0827757.1 helix-turn-helix transcriptional regulator [Brevibacillus laterosporus]